MAWGRQQWKVQRPEPGEDDDRELDQEDLYEINTAEVGGEGPPLGGQEQARPALPPVKLPPRRKRATRDEAGKLARALDPSALAVLPPDVIERLHWRQQVWLAARMVCYSDHQTNLHTNTAKRVLEGWMEQEHFQVAYRTIVLDPLNFQLGLNRLMMAKMAVQKLQLLQHPSLPIRLRVMEMVSRDNAALLAAEAKTKIGQQTNNFIAVSPSEWLRKAAAEGFVMPLDGPDPDARPVIDPGTGILGLLPGPEQSGGFGPLHQDPGRERRPDHGLPAVAVAGPAAEGGAGAEVQHHPQGPPAGGIVVDGVACLVDGELPPQ